MKYILSFAILIACSIPYLLSAQTNNSNSTLPDLDWIGRRCDTLRKSGKFKDAADLYFNTGEKLGSSELFIYAAWQYGLANIPEAALFSINCAIDKGMSNPNILSVYQLEDAGIGSETRNRVDRRLDSIRQNLKRIDNFDIITEPLDTFWPYFDLALKDRDNANRYFSSYIRNGSPVVKDYYHIRYENVQNMSEQMIRKTSAHYIHTHLYYKGDRLRPVKRKMMGMVKNLSKIYPAAVYPKVYLVPGILSGNGTQTELGLYVAAEMFVNNRSMPTEGLTEWQKSNIAPLADMIYVTMHEMMHFQQSYKDDVNKEYLLGKVIQEGVCDYLVELISSKETLAKSRLDNILYLEDKENMQAILSEFRKDMYTNNLANWMYNGGAIKDRPSDLGYTLGYKICKSYYEKAENKQKAISELLNTDDFKKIIRGSAYSDLLEK